MSRSLSALVLLAGLGVVTLGASQATQVYVSSQAEQQLVMEFLPVPARAEGWALAVNDPGQIVGWMRLAGSDDMRATLWDRGSNRVIDLGMPNSQAVDINRSGEIVGYRLLSPQGPATAFLWRDGELIDLGLGGISEAVGINDRGQVIGITDTHPFLWEDGVVTNLETIGPADINNVGQIVGSRQVGDITIPCLLEKDVLTDLSSFLEGPSAWGITSSINERGQIVGGSRAADGSGDAHATLWNKGQIIDLQTLGTASWASAINESGLIVGSVRVRSPEGYWIGHAFVFENGRMTDLSPTPTDYSHAYDINTRGWIVGYWHRLLGTYQLPVLWRRR